MVLAQVRQRRCCPVRWVRQEASEVVVQDCSAVHSDRGLIVVLQRQADVMAWEDQAVVDEAALVPNDVAPIHGVCGPPPL